MSYERSVSYLGTVLLCLTVLASSAPATASSLVYTLGPAAITGQKADFDVIADFDPDAGEKMAMFGIDVSDSDAALVPGGTDYSAFSFTKDSSLLDWGEMGNFPADGSLLEYETPSGSLAIHGLGDGLHTLGVLSVDFAALGLTPGQAYTVSISGPDSVGGVEVPGDSSSFDFLTPSFDPSSQQEFTVPDSTVVIPEPITLTCALLSVGFVGGYVRRKRLS